MSATEQVFSALVAEARQAGEIERATFEASRGAYYGFNGTYCYVVTDIGLWQGRSTVRQLVGGSPTINHWPLQSCRWRERDGKTAVLATPDGEHKLVFSTDALAKAAITALDHGL